MQGNYRRRRNESAEVFTMVLGFRFWNNGAKLLKFYKNRRYFSQKGDLPGFYSSGVRNRRQKVVRW